MKIEHAAKATSEVTHLPLELIDYQNGLQLNSQTLHVRPFKIFVQALKPLSFFSDFFQKDQIFIILEFEFGGVDLENSDGTVNRLKVAPFFF